MMLLLILFLVTTSVCAVAQPSVDFDAKCREYGLVDVRSLNDEILVELKYATEDNFMGVNMYGTLTNAYLESVFALKVVRAQQILKSRYPNYTLLIYDAARPISVQRYMHSAVQGTAFEDFVADGSRGGRHNFGVAVDLTIATTDGVPLDMGAAFDEFSDASAVKGTPDSSDASTRNIGVYRDYINALRDHGVISAVAAENRILLMEIMCEAGLVPYRLEWWHFEELISMADTRQKYRLLDF